MISKIIEEDIIDIVSEFRGGLKGLEGKTLFITGGNGFLPSYLVDTINLFNREITKPIKMVIMNKNYITEKSRLSHLRDNSNVLFIQGNVGKRFEVVGKPDIIIHAASRANPTSFLENPIDTIDANVNGIRTLLDYAKDNPLENFVFFSSAEIYGNPIKEFIPTPEYYTGNINCLESSACYTESKRLAETLAYTFFKKYNVPVKIPRILLAYGPGMRSDGKVVSDFFERAIKDKEITLRDRGDSTRTFCYVKDSARAILSIIFNGKSGEAYNVSSDFPNETISILGLAKMIANIVDKGVKVSPKEKAVKNPPYGIETRQVDITKLRELGFAPKISLKEGLLRLKKHYEEFSNNS